MTGMGLIETHVSDGGPSIQAPGLPPQQQRGNWIRCDTFFSPRRTTNSVGWIGYPRGQGVVEQRTRRRPPRVDRFQAAFVSELAGTIAFPFFIAVCSEVGPTVPAARSRTLKLKLLHPAPQRTRLGGSALSNFPKTQDGLPVAGRWPRRAERESSSLMFKPTPIFKHVLLLPCCMLNASKAAGNRCFCPTDRCPGRYEGRSCPVGYPCVAG